MDDLNYSNNSKFRLGQTVCRRLDSNIPKEKAVVTEIVFQMGGTVKYSLSWEDGQGGSAFEDELLAYDEHEVVTA